MISVFIDNKLDAFQREIRFTFDFIFKTLGYNYKYIRKSSEAGEQDIIFAYSLTQPTDEELLMLGDDRVIFYSPVEVDLYDPAKLDRESISGMLREISFEKKPVPVLATGNLSSPISFNVSEMHFIGRFQFDLIGNIYFNLSHSGAMETSRKDTFGRVRDDAYPFTSYSSFPYINMFLWLIDSTIHHAMERQPGYVLRKSIWPKGEDAAASLSFTVNRLQKWTFSRFIASFFEDFLLFMTLKWKIWLRSFSSKFKYLFTNIEQYWNFEAIADILRAHKLKSTFFFAVEKTGKIGADYTIDDDDLQEVIKSLLENGHDIGLLGSFERYKSESMKDHKDALRHTFDIRDLGIRQDRYRWDAQTTPELHNKMNMLYDSTVAFNERNGFKNGIAYPYYPYTKKLAAKRHYQFVEMQPAFCDEHTRLSRHRSLSLDRSQMVVRKLIQSVTDVNGHIVFDFNTSNFSDIPHNDKLLDYTIDLLTQGNIHIATLHDIAKWWNRRERIQIYENPNEIMIYVQDKITGFTVELLGKMKILTIDGAEYQHKGRHILFRDIKPGTTVTIRLDPVLTGRRFADDQEAAEPTDDTDQE